MAAWFADQRRRRREHYASRPPAPAGRTRALITMVHNEPVFLPIWLGYYSRSSSPRRTSTCSTTRRPTARPSGEGFVRIPVAPRRRRPPLDGADDPGPPARAARSLRHGAGDRRRRDRRPRPPGRDRSASTSTASTRSGSTAWATSCCTCATPSRRCGWTGRSSISATTGSSTTPTTRRRWPPCRCSGGPGFHGRDGLPLQARPRPAHDPPAPDGLRDLPRAPSHAQPPSRGRRSTPREAVGRSTTRSTDDEAFEHWFYEDSCFANLEITPERSAGVARTVLTMASAPLRPIAAGPLADAARAGGLSRLPDAEAVSGATSGSGWCCNRAVDRHLAALGPLEPGGGRDQRRPPRRAALVAQLREPRLPGVRPVRPAGRPPARYDVVICEQVLEHVLDPGAAAANLRGLCAPGGHVVVSTPFLIRVHELPAYGDARLLALHPARAAAPARARRGLEVDRSTPGATATAWPATSTAGPRTGAGTRCATSPTWRCRCGRSRATRAESGASRRRRRGARSRPSRDCARTARRSARP